jgi:hypothetical protein
MRILTKSLLATLCFGTASLLGAIGTPAQTLMRNTATIALKSGESSEVTVLYWVSNCRSLLTATPQVEILDGPPGVTASVKEDMVYARAQKCANPVKGGRLIVSANNIEDQSISTLTLRVTYKTRDGERKFSELLNLELFP